MLFDPDSPMSHNCECKKIFFYLSKNKTLNSSFYVSFHLQLKSVFKMVSILFKLFSTRLKRYLNAPNMNGHDYIYTELNTTWKHLINCFLLTWRIYDMWFWRCLDYLLNSKYRFSSPWCFIAPNLRCDLSRNFYFILWKIRRSCLKKYLICE